MEEKWKRNQRRRSVESVLKEFWESVGGRPWDQEGWPATRDRRLHRHVYTPRRPDSRSEAPYRKHTAGDVLLALERYAQAEAVVKIADDFAKHRITGLSHTRIERYADRLITWWEGRGEAEGAASIDELLSVLSARRKAQDKLPTRLVPYLDAGAGAQSGLPRELQWQRWTLPEIWLFVITGTWPPRIANLTSQHSKSAQWVRKTARIARHHCGGALDDKTAGDLKAWEEALSKLRQQKLRPDGHGPLAEGVSREAVRVALSKGKHPHHWVEDSWCFSSLKLRDGTWLPSQHARSGTSPAATDSRDSGGSV